MADCPICFSQYTAQKKAPIALLCGHTFCLECIVRIVNQNSAVKCFQASVNEEINFEEILILENGNPVYVTKPTSIKQQEMHKFECPICREILHFNADLPMKKNHLIIELLEKLKLLGEEPEGEQLKILRRDFVRADVMLEAYIREDLEVLEIQSEQEIIQLPEPDYEFDEAAYVSMINDPDNEHFGY